MVVALSTNVVANGALFLFKRPFNCDMLAAMQNLLRVVGFAVI
jgi:hypothetical protein